MSTFIYKKEKIGGVNPKAEDISIGDSDISSIGDGTLTGAIAAISNKSIASEEGANDLRYLNGELAVKNSSGEWIVIKTGGSSIQLNQPNGVEIQGGDEEATIKWTDPDDAVVEGFTLAEWDSTILVRKEGTAPTDETDGVVILTNTTKNQYSTEGYVDTGLTNGVTYYYGIFPKTTDGVYTTTSTIGVTPAIIYPEAATNIAVSTNKDNMSATVTFTLPSNTTATVVMKAGSEPSSSTDGTVVSELTAGSATFNNLVLDTTYYFKVYTYNSKNRETGSTSVNAIIKSLNIVTWADGSWEDIAAMIEAHYNGDIDITDYWSNGDTKRVQLNAISLGTTGGGQSAQYIDLTIIDSAHDDLVNPVNGVTKAALTIHSKFCLGTKGYMYANYTGPNYSLWKDSPRRTWCNNGFKNALPAGLVSLIKKVSKVTYRYAKTSYSSYSSYRGSTTTDDEIFLLSEMEVYGTQALPESDYGHGSDGTQYEYYKTASNRIKYLGIDGTSAQDWWLRSSYVGGDGNSGFRSVNCNGNVSGGSANTANGLAPAFCI